MAKILCDICKKFTDYTTNKRAAIRKVGEKEIVFHEKYATCIVAETNITFLGLSMRTKKKLNVFTTG